MLRGDPTLPNQQRALALAHMGLGQLHRMTGRYEASEEAFQRALTITTRLADRPATVWDLDLHTRALLQLGQVEAARPVAKKLLATGYRHPELERLCRLHGVEMGVGR